MKKSSLLLVGLVMTLFIPITMFGQGVQSVSQKKTTPERAAEGQTKWMISQLKLDQSLFKPLYDINLKYQVRADSVHLSNAALTSKKESYLLYSQIRNTELMKVLSSDQYNKYQNILETIKANAKPTKK